MARIKRPNFKSENESLKTRLGKYLGSFVNCLNDLCKRVGHLFYVNKGSDLTHDQRESIKNDTASQLLSLTRRYQTVEWNKSNLVQDDLFRSATKLLKKSFGDKEADAYHLTNEDVLKAFQQRKVKGLTLSKRIWNDTEELIKELECAVAVTLEEGKLDEVAISRKLSKYLADYDGLQKAYKEKFGKEADCMNMEWRVLRLVRNEINMAYRLAQITRWRQMGFISGMDIHISDKPDRKDDMCNLLQGKYPLWMDWLGWHVNCMCYCTPIISEEKAIDELPANYKEWVINNRERIRKSMNSGTAHQFLVDNKDEVNNIIDESYRSYKLNDEDYKKLKEMGVMGMYEPTTFNNSPMKGFNLLEFSKVIKGIFSDYGIDVTITIASKCSDLIVSGNGVRINRSFSISKKGRSVSHKEFYLKENIQGKGISKRVSRVLFENYESMGLDYVYAQANDKIGAYCWGRYGFCTEPSQISKIIEDAFSSGIITRKEYNKAKKIVRRSSGNIVHMERIAGLTFGKRMLEEQSWSGVFMLKDKFSKLHLHKYLGLR